MTNLDLKSNEIAELPDEISQLVACKKIDVSHNMLTELPWTIGSMTELKNLDLSHNPLVIPPRVVIQKGTEEGK